MADIYLNTNIISNETFDSNGNFLRDYNPIFPYKSEFRLHWQLYTDTPGANSDGIDMSSWTKANFSGCGAVVTCDNDFVHRITGTLATAITSGTEISSITVNIGNNQLVIPASGYITLFDASGGTKDFVYESVTFSGTTGTFVIGSWEADGNYSIGTTAKVSQEPYFQSYYNASLSDPATGLFVFDCNVYSRKLAIQGDAASGRWIDVQGIELLPFQIIDNVYTEMPSYLCDTARISVNMGESGNNPEITDPIQNMIAAFVTNMISAGMEVQGSEDGENWSDYEDITDFQALRWYRFRINGSGSEWSQAIPLISGATWYSGSGSPSGSVGVNGDWYIDTATTDVYLKSSGSWALQFRLSVLSPSGAWDNATAYPMYSLVSYQGSMYIANENTSAGDTPGVSSKWILYVSKGDTGATGATGQNGTDGKDGSEWLSGSAAPSSGSGNDGDWYIDTSSGYVYNKVSGSWVQQLNVIGPAGAGVNPRGDWVNNISYVAADMVTYQGSAYIAERSNTGVTPGTSSADWTLYISKGADGTNGTDGVTPHIGNNGNWYIGDTDTEVHAQGPAGQNGTNGTNGTDGITPTINSTNKHWMIGTTDTGVIAEAQLINSYANFNSVSVSNTVTFSGVDLVPVGVLTSSGNYYPVEKMSVTISGNSTILDVSPYLAYDNSSSFSGTWRVYFAAGGGGQQIQGVAVGTVHSFAGDAQNIPSGYLLCNGAAISRTDYAALFSAIGTIYGTGDGSTTFNLPDFRGKFLRGYLSGTSAAMGTVQGDAMRKISGSIGNILSAYTAAYNNTTWTGSMRHLGAVGGPKVVGSDDTQVAVANVLFDSSQEVPTAAEVRPENYAVNYIIKY